MARTKQTAKFRQSTISAHPFFAQLIPRRINQQIQRKYTHTPLELKKGKRPPHILDPAILSLRDRLKLAQVFQPPRLPALGRLDKRHLQHVQLLRKQLRLLTTTKRMERERVIKEVRLTSELIQRHVEETEEYRKIAFAYYNEACNQEKKVWALEDKLKNQQPPNSLMELEALIGEAKDLND